MGAISRSPQARFLDVLSNVGQIVSSGRSLETILHATVNLIKTILDVERSSILLLDPAEQVLKLKAASSIDPNEWDKVRIVPGTGIAGKVAADGRPMLVENVDASPYAGLSPRGRYSTSSFICVPLIVKGQVIGVINVNNATDSTRFTRDDLDLVTAVAGLIALTIDNARLISASDTMRAHLETIVESLPIGILAFDLKNRVILSNRRLTVIFGIPAPGPFQQLEEILPASIKPVILELAEETVKYGVDTTREHALPNPFDLSPAGGFIPLEIGTTPLCTASGVTDGVLVTFEDLSMRKEIDELRRLDQMKSNFLSLVSHELRTPLTSIKGAVHLLMNSSTSAITEQSGQMLLDIVNNNTDRLTRLVNDLLDIVQIEDQTLVINKRPENLQSLIAECVAGYQTAAAARNVQLFSDLDPVHASADRLRLSQAIGQLLDNAVKFTPKKGRVDVTLEERSDMARIVVRDSGPGIPAEAHSRLFTKFFQVHNPLTRSAGGTGIGLYLTKCIVALHGGQVTATEGLTEGAEFVIEIPLRSETEITF